MAARLMRTLLPAIALLAIAGCGNPATVTNTSSPSPTPDVSAASAAALTIFFAVPNAQVWLPCASQAANMADCPFTQALKDRLVALSAAKYFSDAPPGVCGEDYITGTQNGLNTEPKVLSAAAGAGGLVTVVISRGSSPDLTVTMTDASRTWLASDLASGTGPQASIFSTKPNC